MNPKVNGQIQREWGWLVAIYLFLGGVGAGAYAIAAFNSFLGKILEPSTAVGLWIGFPALFVGSMSLVADLGTPRRAFLAGMKPRTSWIARGTWIISTFMVVAFVHGLLVLFTDLGGRPEGAAMLKGISVVGIVLAAATMAYTGILLGASKGITLWRTGVVPVVFVVSALVTGHFAIMIGLVLLGNRAGNLETLRFMGAEAATLVVFEVLAILFLLQAAWKQPDPRESVDRLLRSPLFVVGYALVGLLAPLALMLALYRGMPDATAGAVLAVAAVGAALGLAGGLILRQAVLVVGALPTLNVGGFEFRRVARPKEPKPAMGSLPPH